MSNMEIHSNRRLRTVVSFFISFSVGFSLSTMGPTLVSMEILLDVNTKQMAFNFVSLSLGFTTGAFLTGVLYARVNKERTFAIVLLLLSLATICAPYTGSLYGYMACNFIVGTAVIFLDSANQAYLAALWNGHHRLNTVVQAMRAMVYVGFAIGPIVVRPFLVDLSFLQTHENETFANQNFTHPTSGSFQDRGLLSNRSMPNDIFSYNLSRDEIIERVSPVKFAYVCVGTLLLLPCAVCSLVYCMIQRPFSTNAQIEMQAEKALPDLVVTENKRFRVTFMLLASLIFALYICLEYVPANYIAVFVVKGLHFPNSYGAYISSTNWGTYMVGRALAIPLSLAITTTQLLVANMSLILIGVIIMLFSNYHGSVIWISVIIAALGSSSCHPCFLLWTSEYITFNGRAASMIYIAISIGNLSGSYLVGYLFEMLGHMTLVYVMLSAIIMICVVFICAQCYGSHYSKRKIENMTQTVDAKNSLQNEGNDIEIENPL